MNKPGYKTSEFWFTLVSFIISGLFLVGVISEPDTKDDLIGVSTHVVESIILIGGQFAFFSRYLAKRRKQREADDNIKREIEDYIGVDKKHDRININKAGLGDLIQLPHIGPATAQKIIDYRIDNGHFKDIMELLRVSGIGESILKDIEKYIIL